MNQPWVYMCPPSRTPLPPPSPSHPSGLSQCTSFEYPVSCIKVGLVIYFTHGNMLQCYSLQSSHPRLLPQRPKVCSLHVSLFCCLTYWVIITIFLNSIHKCINILYWCFSFQLTSLCIIGSSFIHLIKTDSNAFFLMDE